MCSSQRLRGVATCNPLHVLSSLPAASARHTLKLQLVGLRVVRKKLAVAVPMLLHLHEQQHVSLTLRCKRTQLVAEDATQPLPACIISG